MAAQSLIITEDMSWSMEYCDNGVNSRQDEMRNKMDRMICDIKQEVGETEIDVYHGYFNCTVFPVTGPYRFQTFTMDTVEKKQPRFGTALYKAIVHAVKFAVELPGMKKLVILTDGLDEDSKDYKDECIRMLGKEFTSQHNLKVHLYGSTLIALSNKATFADVSFYSEPAEEEPMEFEGEHMSQSSISATSSDRYQEDSFESFYTPPSQIGTLSQLSQGLAHDFMQSSC